MQLGLRPNLNEDKLFQSQVAPQGKCSVLDYSLQFRPIL